MRVGIHLPHIGRKAGPEAIRRAAIQAEELGFADVWTSEHIIIPKGAPYPPSAVFWDPVLTLTWAAACTQRVGLGTSVLVLPMRHPLPLAKELATLQNLSSGRLILGAGVGWLEAEFAALGVPFRERGRRMGEGIAGMGAGGGGDPGVCVAGGGGGPRGVFRRPTARRLGGIESWGRNRKSRYRFGSAAVPGRRSR